MAYSAFLFDLDGTLIDSNAHVIHCFQTAFQRILGQDLPLETITATFGIPLEKAIYDLNPSHANLLLKAYREESAQRSQHDITLIPEAKNTLAELKASGARCAVVTSKKRVNAYKSLDALGLSAYLDAFIGPEDSQQHKPHPEPVLLALQALDVTPKEALMVGDSPHDIASGKAAGIDTCAVRFAACGEAPLKKAKPTIFIDSLTELLQYRLLK